MPKCPICQINATSHKVQTNVLVLHDCIHDGARDGNECFRKLFAHGIPILETKYKTNVSSNIYRNRIHFFLFFKPIVTHEKENNNYIYIYRERRSFNETRQALWIIHAERHTPPKWCSAHSIRAHRIRYRQWHHFDSKLNFEDYLAVGRSKVCIAAEWQFHYFWSTCSRNRNECLSY